MELGADHGRPVRNTSHTWDTQFLAAGDYIPALDALMQVLHAKDSYTASHCRRVRRLAESVSLKVGLDPLPVRTAMLAGLYHDIGKLGIVNSVLAKPGRLTASEWRSITAHPTIGRELLESFLSVQRAALVIQQHHESWDGSGYPLGLQEEEILPEARVLRVCDVYDALLSDRPYRPAYAHSQAVEIIANGIGTEFEPEAAEALLTITDELHQAA